MPSTSTLLRLDRLREDRNEWGTLGTRQRLSALVEGVLITIDHNAAGNTLWQVEVPAEESVILSWTPASGIAQAMRESTDYTRAYLLQLGEPAHLPEPVR